MRPTMLTMVALWALQAGCVTADHDDRSAVDGAVVMDATAGIDASYFDRCRVKPSYAEVVGQPDASASREWPFDDPNRRTDIYSGLEWDYQAHIRTSVALVVRPGEGVFADGIHTGTFVLKGPDLFPETCSLCVYVETQYLGRTEPEDREQYEKCYFARGGTVTLTSLVDRFSGSASDLTFSEARSCYAPYELLDIDCTTRIDSWTFDGAIGGTTE